MADRTSPGDRLSGKPMNVVHLQFLPPYELAPEHRLGDDRAVDRAIHQRRLDRAGIGIIAFVVAGIDLDLLDDTGRPELDDDPVIAGLPPSPRLPAIAHVDAAPF